MSKHLRFGKLLGMLAIMLTLSLAWNSVSAQNTSSEKVLYGFKFLAADNAALDVDAVGTVTGLTVAVTLPFEYGPGQPKDIVAANLVAKFATSDKSNFFKGANPTGFFLGEGLGATSWITGLATTYASGTVLTVEAENHSYENYTLTVTFAAALTGKDMMSFSAAWTKPWTGPCTAPTNGTFSGNAPGTFSGLNVTYSVPFGTNLAAVTVTLTKSMWATVAPASGSVVDFSGGPVSFVVTAQSGATQTYSVSAVVGTASVLDDLLAYNMTNSTSVLVDNTTQTIAVTIPWSTTSSMPSWTVSPYAHVFSNNPVPGPGSEECSGVSAMGTVGPGPFTYNFWIQGEDPSEVSEYVVTITKSAASTAKDITAINGDWSKLVCGVATTSLVPEVGTISGTTITFNVPYGVTGVTVPAVGGIVYSTLATGSFVNPLVTGSTITVTAEDGSSKVYTVAITAGAAANGKQMMTFGFNMLENNPFSFPDWTVNYPATIDQTAKRITVEVAWNTDLHDLVAYFTSSPFSCVSIAESNLTYTPQTTKLTVNDHSNTLTYVVVAEDGTEERYEVIVTKAMALDGKDLMGFSLVDMGYCFGSAMYNVPGVYTGTNIAVSVKNSVNVGSLKYAFSLSTGATASIAASGTANFSAPVTVTVTAQNGTTQTYTITVTKRALNTAAKLLTYKFEASKNGAFGIGSDAIGIPDPTNEFQIDVWVPWEARGANLTALVATFTLSNGATMTHSEDVQLLQTSGSTPNDFTTPVAYTVFPEDCAPTVEYFVTVHVIPDVNTGISTFDFAVSGCGCDLVNKIDPYARRIYITLPYTMSISSLAPTSIGLAQGATISPAVTAKQNWTTGPKKYTVTAPDGVAKADWMVYVTNPACQETDILTWDFAGGVQVGASVIDDEAHTIDIVVKKGTNLKNMSASISFSCGASICCNMGACAGTTIDFSDNMCHTCVITAQDESITQDWTICLTYEDTDVPLVTTWSVMAYNCADSAAVQSNEMGYVFLLHESAINFSTLPYPTPNYAINTAAGRTAMVNAHMGAFAAVDSANYPKYVQINNLYSGVYWAFAVDMSGNISCVSAQKLFLDICEVDVADLCALRAAVPVYRFRVTGQVFVSYEETRPGGNWKFVQDASCGILVEDLLGALPTTYGAGAGLTNLVGTLSTDYTGRNMTLNPVCCYTPTKSSTGNVINPIMMTYGEFYASAYTGSHVYESMLVRITTPMKAFDDYGLGYLTWEFDQLDLATTNAAGAYDWFITKDFNNTDYIGVAIPTAPTIYQGIRRNVNWGSTYGLITPRKKADIIKVTGSDVIADPNPAEINGVLPGQCGTVMIDIINQGVDPATVTAVYLDDSPGTDEFDIVNPTSVPWPALTSWAANAVRVDFCPLDAGNETTNLVVEYGVGKVLVVPINGTTLVAYPMPYYQTFNCLPSPNNEWCNTNMNVNSARHGWSGTYTGSAETLIYSGWGDQYEGNTLHMRVRGVVGGVRQPVVVETPGFIVSGSDPVVSWMEAQMAAYKSPTNNDMRTLSISTDKVTWTQIYATTSANVPTDLDGYRKIVLSLAAYTGQTVFFRFDMAAQPSNSYNYYNVDNFFVEERVTGPLFSAAPDPHDFGGVQVGETATQTFTVTNAGISVMPVKSVSIVGDGFTLTDANTYPTEVQSGAFAYAINGTTALTVDVSFSPDDVGLFAGKLVVVYGMYGDMVAEIPFTGEGLSCYTAAEAHIGENHFFQNSWFKYTAESFQLVNINSCHPNNTTDPYVYSYDTWLYVYADCEGTLLAQNDDLEWVICPSNRASSGVDLVMNAGETVYIFWPWAFTSEGDANEMIFNIVPNYPIDGDVCETAIPLTLPVVNMFGSTKKFNDDYDASPCSPFSNYMDGNDVVYTITLPYDGYLTGNILGAYGSIHVLDKCPKEELAKENCKAFVGGPMGGQFEKRIQGGTYYVIVSTWAPPQTVDFLLNLHFRGTGVDDEALMGNLSVFPNPTNGKFTVSISNTEASDMTIELVNISGQVVYRNNVKAAYSYNEEIDASEFAKGVYYLKVNDGNGVKIEKVVVQ